MTPTRTRYRLAASPEEYAACQALQAPATDALEFPTVMAWRDGQPVGFLATRPRAETGGMLYAGPMVVSPTIARPAIICLRLIEAYEQILRLSGVVIEYRQHVARANVKWKRIVDHLPGHFLLFHEDESGWWYRRLLVPARVREEVA